MLIEKQPYYQEWKSQCDFHYFKDLLAFHENFTPMLEYDYMNLCPLDICYLHSSVVGDRKSPSMSIAKSSLSIWSL